MDRMLWPRVKVRQTKSRLWPPMPQMWSVSTMLLTLAPVAGGGSASWRRPSGLVQSAALPASRVSIPARSPIHAAAAVRPAGWRRPRTPSCRFATPSMWFCQAQASSVFAASLLISKRTLGRSLSASNTART